MFTQSFRRAVAVTATALLSTASFVAAQDQEPTLKITRPILEQKQHNRSTPVAELRRDAAFHRIHPAEVIASQQKHRRSERPGSERVSVFGRTPRSTSAPALLSFGTGGGDINEIEPNDPVAQGVSLPVNVFGKISFNRDVDFFAFEATAGEQITIEPFATRLRNSELVADIALFDSSGRILDSDVGDENDDPLIRFVSPRDQVLIVGISDADDLGGPLFDYLLNITRGRDFDEQEPNDRSAQRLSDLPATVFGEIDIRDDVDFYSFTASAGQTLIVDVDAEVLGSHLDAEMNLIDPETGIEFFYNDQYDGDDPRFNIVLPYTGRYVVGVGAFNSNSTGFYRLNASLVSPAGAPIINRVTRLSKKFIEVTGAGFKSGSVVEVNGVARSTTTIDSRTLRARVKSKTGNVVTVSSPPDDRRSNPLLVP
jgi:hypothetical protein